MADADEHMEVHEDYNQSLHVAALFINLAASALGVLLPVLLLYTTFSTKTSARISACIQVGKTFGTGVILATAFIHMLPAAFECLSDPSLPSLFHEGEGYGAWAGLVAMLTALVMHLIEFAATQQYFKFESSAAAAGRFGNAHDHDQHQASTPYNDDDKFKRQYNTLSDAPSLEGGCITNLISMQEALHQPLHAHSHSGQIILQSKKTLTASVDAAADVDGLQHHHHRHHHISQGGPEGSHNLSHVSGGNLALEQRAKILGTYILEIGIAMHSVIIGISLGSTVGTQFTSLLIALVFHQFFEGVALGGRIASLGFSKSSFKPWLMVLLFAISTPVGVAIGIGVHESYKEDDTDNVIIHGMFDSVAAGILLYTALVQLLTMEMSASTEFRRLTLANRTIQFVALWTGAGTMAIIGKWA